MEEEPRPEVRVLEGPAGIEELAGEWEHLADRVVAPVWWRPPWFRAWWRAFGRGRLEILVTRRGGRLAGVVPLQRGRGQLRSVTNYHSPPFGLLAEDEAARRGLADALVARARRRLSIGFLPSEEPSAAALEGAALRAGRRSITRVLERSPYVVLDGSFAAYLGARRGHLGREVRRRHRRLASRGQFEFAVLDGRQDLDRLLEEGFAVEAAGWKGEQGTAIASRPATREFYREIARWLATRGVLRLAFLRLDGRAFAFDFAIEDGGSHSLLKTGFDPAFRVDGPGILLRALMLERAFDLGMRRYNFLGQADPWKREWADTLEEHLLIQAFVPTPAGLLDWAAQRYLRPFARRLLRRTGPT